MAFVPLINSNAQLIITDSAGTARNFTAYWVGGHPQFSNDAVEVTSIADAAKRNLIGLADTAMTFNFDFDTTTGSGGMYFTFTNLKISGQNGTNKNVVYYPDGTASGKPIITIPAKLSAFNLDGGVGAVLTCAVTFVADGAATFGTV